jgi:hypothetical protein
MEWRGHVSPDVVGGRGLGRDDGADGIRAKAGGMDGAWCRGPLARGIRGKGVNMGRGKGVGRVSRTFAGKDRSGDLGGRTRVIGRFPLVDRQRQPGERDGDEDKFGCPAGRDRVDHQRQLVEFKFSDCRGSVHRTDPDHFQLSRCLSSRLLIDPAGETAVVPIGHSFMSGDRELRQGWERPQEQADR